METVYSSKIDTWLAAVLLIAAVGVLVLAWHLTKTRGMFGILVMAPAVLGAVGLPLWLFMDTHYTLAANELRIKSGPVFLSMPVADIRSITPTRDALSSPALSLDRLRIVYGDGKSVMISPKDKEAFLRDIESRGATLNR